MFGLSRCLLGFFLALSYRGNIGTFAEDSTELVHLKKSHLRVNHSEDLSSSVLPKDFRVEFRAHGHLVRLKFVKNSHIPKRIPLCVFESNETICLTQDDNNKSYELYHDPDNNAAVSVKIEQITPETYFFKLSGEYTVGNELFEIVPADRKVLRKTARRNFHYIKRRSVSGNPELEIPEAISNRKKKNQYGVELLIIVDHSIFNKFMENNNNSIVESSNKIRYYFAHIANAIDLRFSSIKDLDVYIRLAGYLIIKNISSTPFFAESLNSTQEGDKLDGLTLLNGLKDFLKQRNDLPPYDHAMFFTKYETFNTESKILGSTYASGVCSDSKISLIVDRGAYTSAGTAAHELAHNLGVTDHDGDGDAKNCSRDMHYIMSPYIEILNSNTKEYGFKFSPCSVAQLSKKLAELDNNKENCLENQALTKNPAEFSKYMEVLPGQIENVHDQCRQIYGKYSFMCPPKYPSEICYKMLCYIPSKKICLTKSEQKAAMGTPCGNRKWCILGKCVANNSAPVVADDCPYPDLPNPINCSQASPFLCKMEDFYKRCCDSCNKNFTAQESCKDVPVLILSRYKCPEFLEAHGTIQCQKNENIKQYCCASCKARTDQSEMKFTPNTPLSSNCTDRSDIQLNGVNCSRFLYLYGREMCKENLVKTTCCASCTL